MDDKTCSQFLFIASATVVLRAEGQPSTSLDTDHWYSTDGSRHECSRVEHPYQEQLCSCQTDANSVIVCKGVSNLGLNCWTYAEGVAECDRRRATASEPPVSHVRMDNGTTSTKLPLSEPSVTVMVAPTGSAALSTNSGLITAIAMILALAIPIAMFIVVNLCMESRRKKASLTAQGVEGNPGDRGMLLGAARHPVDDV